MRAGVIGIVAFARLLVCEADVTAQEIAYAKENVRPTELNGSSFVREEISSFIVSSAVDRMRCAEAGRLAAEKGTTNAIKAYGELMIKDQGRLLGELKRLAVLNGITISENDYEGDLKRMSGRQFNRTFVKMMIAEHERDLRLFKEAMASGDPEVSAFAARYIPLIESHLTMIKDIKR
jgi:putative membrane protein